MATNAESTTTLASPALARSIEYDPARRSYAMSLEGDLIGYARSYHHAEVTLDELEAEIQALQVTPLALPPLAAVADTLDKLALVAEPTSFVEARAQLAAGVPIVADGPALWIDSLQVQPEPSRVGWPWACPCEQACCWHAALAEALVVTRERLADLVGDAAEVGR